MSSFSGIFPFSAIYGQEAARKALILCAVNPRIGGVLICGEKGAAKSLCVRAFGRLVGAETIAIPLNCTEDRLIGSLDIEKTIQSGKACFLPGLLYSAHNNIVYIDEVNLLPDHLVDALLEVSASRRNLIEREGVSHSHPSDFILTGTMNLEEGFLRPQFLDRFGLFVSVNGVRDVESRVEIAKRVSEFEASARAFRKKYQEAEERCAARIAAARERLKTVGVNDEDLKRITDRCLEANVEGHRADIVLRETARALAAWEGRAELCAANIEEAAFFALPHRRKNAPEEERARQNHQNQQDNQNKENNETRKRQEEREEQHGGDDTKQDNKREDGREEEAAGGGGEAERQKKADANAEGNEGESARPSNARTRVFQTGSAFEVRDITRRADRKRRNSSGRRSAVQSASKAGRYIYSTRERRNNDIALDATIRAAAPFQAARRKEGGAALVIKPEDIREKARQKKSANFLVFALDSSGSMGARERMIETKGAVLSLLKDAYIKRDKIALIAFRNDGAQMLLPPTASVQRAYTLLRAMPTGGKTPLNAGLYRSFKLIKAELRKNALLLPLLIVITDGKGNVPLTPGQKAKAEMLEIGGEIAKNKKIHTLVIDIEQEGMMKMGCAKELAASLNARYYKADELKKEAILSMVNAVKSDDTKRNDTKRAISVKEAL